MHLLKTIAISMLEFLKDECVYLAASISFFAILSLVPMGLLIVALFGYLMGENEALYQFILSGLVNLFPAVTKGITSELKNIITFKEISIVMLFVYGFISLQLFYSAERAINIIFKIPKKRHILLSIFWSVFTITLVMIFLLLSFIISSVPAILKKYSLSILFKYIAPFVLALMIFTAIYVIIPKVKVSLGNAFKGALFVTILWELAKYFFTYYVKNVSHFGAIYGLLTTFILFLLWIYYSSCIFLLGAEFVNKLGRKA